MTHPLTPREKVAVFESCPGCGADEPRNRCLGCSHDFAPRNRQAIFDGSPVTALASGSGDHAELARLAEWRDRLRADPGRAAHFGSPYADKPMQNGRTYWNSDLADDITALIAEVAALRAQNDVLHAERIGLRSAIFGSDNHDPFLRHASFIEMARTNEDARKGALARATEAERKLAEAVGVVEWYGENARLARLIHSEGDAGRNALADDGGKRARTFLSKEAERG